MTGHARVDIIPSLTQVAAGTAVVVPLFDGQDVRGFPGVAQIGGDRLESALCRGGVRARKYRETLFHAYGDVPALLLIGAGSATDSTPYEMRLLYQAASRTLTGAGYPHLAFFDEGQLEDGVFARAACEGAVLGAYNAGIKKTAGQTHGRHLEAVTLVSNGNPTELRRGGEIGRLVGEGRNEARTLVNLPPNELTPRELARRSQSWAEEDGLRCEVLDEEMMRELGMGTLLAVSAGSGQPARLIVLGYGPEDAPVRLAIVGKGLTFDSGGLSIKTAEGMMTMKGDMAGAAAALAGVRTVARAGVEGVCVTAYVGATENMPGASAMRPGDVVTAFNGESVEILNTDAEGRLVLADVLAYAASRGATHLVDLATLTGGARVALGNAATLATGKPMEWVRQVVGAADCGLERAWPMPLFDDYRRAMDSTVADIKNTGGREGSPLTAAAFLSDFVNGTAWAHLDIAGTAFGEARPYRPAGATGVGVGTIVSLAQRLAGVPADRAAS